MENTDSDDSDYQDYSSIYHPGGSYSGSNPFGAGSGFRYQRRNIRGIKKFHELGALTQAAYHEERERKNRLHNRERVFQSGLSLDSSRLILDFNEQYVPIVEVHKDLVVKLKDHQRSGIRFMWDSTIESVSRCQTDLGTGCILAHCMGLGKTLQIISLVHTVLTHKDLNISKVMIVCPKNTVLNWIHEFSKWITPSIGQVKIFNPTRFDKNSDRLNKIMSWHTSGGVCIINYDLFRILIEREMKDVNQTGKANLKRCLVDPGPQLVVMDEGHIIKNDKTKLHKALKEIKTKRRIILTGTPLQNNLMEYYCMVEFIRPYLLGTKQEFRNMFENPIKNGQYENSLYEDVRLMKERAHVLRKTSSACIQRYDVTILSAYLPEKFETVLLVKLTDKQADMYQKYLDLVLATEHGGRAFKGFFADYQLLQRVWTHPFSLKLYSDDRYQRRERRLRQNAAKNESRLAKSNETSDSSFEDEDHSDENDVFLREDREWVNEWWKSFVDNEDLYFPHSGAKVSILLNIIQMCGMRQEKLLIFSGSLYSLQMIQHFLTTYCNGTDYRIEGNQAVPSTWTLGKDFLVMTGATSGEERDRDCNTFNNPDNPRARLYMISTRAGSLGINLTAANRIVIFDASWNPAHDIQSIFRIYRLGQTKKCFIYRLLSSGTMDEKVYERQVTKQSMSKRVVDEKQIARHYTQQELAELYTLDLNKCYNPPQVADEDTLLKELLIIQKDNILGCHQHDSLLKHCKDEELNQGERDSAWGEYNDAVQRDNVSLDLIPQYNSYESAKEAITKLINDFNPSSFDPSALLVGVKIKYPGLSNDAYLEMVDNLIPRVFNLFSQPDYKDLLINIGLKIHINRSSVMAFEQ